MPPAPDTPPPVPPAPSGSLCVADEATFWPNLRWPQFKTWPDKARTLVVVPLAGLCDAGLGHPLDAEETVLTAVLRAASASRPGNLPLLVLPPLRFVLGPHPGCAFPIGPAVAHALVREVVESVVASGFRRVVLFNSSPWNEDLVDAAARDLRVSLGIQTFCVNLGALGLDFHPARSRSRRTLQTVLTALYRREPRQAPPVGAASTFVREAPVPLPAPWESLAAAGAEAPAVLEGCAALLASLLGEIHAHPELPDSTPL